jgi:hypothetical protein
MHPRRFTIPPRPAAQSRRRRAHHRRLRRLVQPAAPHAPLGTHPTRRGRSRILRSIGRQPTGRLTQPRGCMKPGMVTSLSGRRRHRPHTLLAVVRRGVRHSTQPFGAQLLGAVHARDEARHTNDETCQDFRTKLINQRLVRQFASLGLGDLTCFWECPPTPHDELGAVDEPGSVAYPPGDGVVVLTARAFIGTPLLNSPSSCRAALMAMLVGSECESIERLPARPTVGPPPRPHQMAKPE